MPDAADPTPLDKPKMAVPPTPDVPEPETTGHRLLDLDRPDCPACRGTGKVQTTADHLRDLAALLPSSGADLDVMIAEFYSRLLAAAPHLAEFFPPDLTTGDALNSHGNKQRDQLLQALVAILTRYDPDHPDGDPMQSLLANAATWGRSHAEWQAADGSMYVPSEEDYLLVRTVLVQLLGAGLGARLQDVHVKALVAAYRTVSLTMQQAADQWRMSRGAPAVARRVRQ